MLRVTTLYAGSAAATARYYTKYLTQASAEQPGQWLGAQAAGFGLSGEVTTDTLELLLSGRDPVTGTTLGYPLKDRTLATGKVVRAVSGFDATLSAPKSLSTWWALTGDEGLVECHDVAVAAVVELLGRYGSTTRVRSNGGRLHPDSQGLTVAAFGQTTSRLDDPQLHTHLVISGKVQTVGGRWLALDARVLKKHQRALGGLYQSVLRAEFVHRYGVGFEPIVCGQAEIAGVPADLLAGFSKRSVEVDAALRVKVAEFAGREGRDPSRFERAALEREAAVDTRRHKTGQAATGLRARWCGEAADLGHTAATVTAAIIQAGREQQPPVRVATAEIIADLSENASVWHRMDVVRAVTDRLRPQPGIGGVRWAMVLDRAVDRVIEHCVSLDPNPSGATSEQTSRRVSDGRSVWIEPVAARFTSEMVLAQEEHIIAWAIDAQADPPAPSTTVHGDGLDVLQIAAAAAAAGGDRLVLIVGPAGAGKTTMLHAAVTDLCSRHHPVFGLAPTAKAAQVLERETAMASDTVAKLLYEWSRPEGPGDAWQLTAGCTVVVDEAGMLNTADLHRLVRLADTEGWRLALVGDPRQLQAVGRGGMFSEVCDTGRTVELERVHRFTNRWEAAASLRLRHGDRCALDAYQAHQRIIPGTLAEHVERIAGLWIDSHKRGESMAVTTTRNEHVEQINTRIQTVRAEQGDLDTAPTATVADGGQVHVGDIVATRRNDRRLHTDTGDVVRNRQRWTVTGIADTGDLTVTRLDGNGSVTLPAGYVAEFVRLGYAATEPGNQSDTATRSITLATTATTGRGLYVAITRGRDENLVCVVTDNHDIGEARDMLDAIVASDRADVPATTQRRLLADQDRQPVLAARCHIPGWFQQFRHDTTRELHEAARAATETAATHARLQRAVAMAEHRHAAAVQACAPFETAVTRARDELDRRHRAHDVAGRHLGDVGRLGRRSARADLAATSTLETVAEQALRDVERDATPTDRQRATARQELTAARDAAHDHAVDERFLYLPERLHAAEQHLDTLDRWHAWAQGQPLSTDEVVELAANLTRDRDDSHDHGHGGAGPEHAVMADALRRWAQPRGIDIHPTRQPAIERNSHGLELDL